MDRETENHGSTSLDSRVTLFAIKIEVIRLFFFKFRINFHILHFISIKFTIHVNFVYIN